jgi:hypothetical protein
MLLRVVPRWGRSLLGSMESSVLSTMMSSAHGWMESSVPGRHLNSPSRPGKLPTVDFGAQNSGPLEIRGKFPWTRPLQGR